MSELARNLECSENTAYEYLLRRSPFEMKVRCRGILRLPVAEGLPRSVRGATSWNAVLAYCQKGTS